MPRLRAARREEGADAGGGGGSEAGVRLLTTLLTEMDGMEQATGALVMRCGCLMTLSHIQRLCDYVRAWRSDSLSRCHTPG